MGARGSWISFEIGNLCIYDFISLMYKSYMFVLFDLKLGSSHDIEVNDTKEGLILKVMAHHRLLSKLILA